jgi:hypothetical protein
MLKVQYTIMATCFILGSVLNFPLAASLSKRRSWLFCNIVSAINCIYVPFGTALGVWTLATLQRPSVKELFGHAN